MSSTIASVGSAALVRIPAGQQANAARNQHASGRADGQAIDPSRSDICVGRIDDSETTKAAIALSGYVTEVWSRLLAWKMRRATRIILNSFDDRLLQDIGLPRGEIDSALRDIERWRVHWST